MKLGFARLRLALVSAALSALWLSAAPAEDVSPPASVASCDNSDYCQLRSCCTCCDNYCPKPQPCVPCAPLGCCNDYCAKPYPCPPCRLCYCGLNDYCPKPYCFNLSCCWPAWYSCGAIDCPSRTEPIQISRTSEE